jgi:hypothetical protein
VPRPGSYPAVFDAAVALLTGRVLRGCEADAGRGEGAWGVLSCRGALGAFDARSDAWCGRDGIPHRYSREEAEDRARRMSGSSYDDSGYAALEIPSKPRLVMAGRHCSAVGDSLCFECVDWTDGPANVVTVGSAYDAAAAFVALMGERLTYAALAEAA